MHYHQIHDSNEESIHIIQLGIGLIGKSLSDYIASYYGERRRQIKESKLEWHDPDHIIMQLKSIEKIIHKKSVTEKIHIIWSAGKSGFLSNEKECDQEYGVFCKIINFLAHDFCKSSFDKSFYLFSSAGGLYEGQYVFDKHMEPTPKRHYGFLKLKQENYLSDKKSFFKSISILRPSSVFSHNLFNKRLGIIGVLISNGILNKVTKIFGTESTLRDYILAEDIAAFIVKLIETQYKKGYEVFFLISALPISIFRLKVIIADLIGQPLLIQYLGSSNSDNILYHHSIKPRTLFTRPLTESLKLTKENFLKS